MVRTVKCLAGEIKKVLVFMAFMVFLLQGFAKADTLSIGGTYTYPIYMTVNGAAETYGGGSVDPSSLNGESLEYLYCVELFNEVYVSREYDLTVVTTTGTIHGNTVVNNAGEVAWLLSNYGTSGQGDSAYALQAAIWHEVYDYNGSLYNVALNTTLSSDHQKYLYNLYLNALGNNTGNVEDFLWILPGDSNGTYQGLVGALPVPEQGTMFLLGSGLVGLAAFGRKKLGKKY